MNSLRSVISYCVLASTALAQGAAPPDLDWLRQFGGLALGNNIAQAVDASGAVYVCGANGGDVFLSKAGADGTEIWTRTFGTLAQELVREVLVDATGVVVAGTTAGTLGDTNLGSTDAFLRKYDHDGNILWTRQFGDSGANQITAATMLSGMIYVCATIAGGPFFLAKYDGAGNQIWFRQQQFQIATPVAMRGLDDSIYLAGGSGDVTVLKARISDGAWTGSTYSTTESEQVADIAVSGQYVYVTGAVTGNLLGNPSAGGQDVFILRYSLTLQNDWGRQYGSAGSDTGTRILVDATGIYLGGTVTGTFSDNSGGVSEGGVDSFVRKIEFTGDVIWTARLGTTSADTLRGMSFGPAGIVVCGNTTGVFPFQNPAEPNNAFLASIDGSGATEWIRQFGYFAVGNVSDAATAVGLDGSVFVAGQTGGTLPGQTNLGGTDCYLRKYGINGSEAWTRQFGSSSSEAVAALAVDATGIYVVGSVQTALPGQVSSGGQDIFLAKYDHDGQALWTRQFGSAGQDQGTALAVEGGAVWIAGIVNGPIDGQTFGGGGDNFLQKRDTNGDLLWTRLSGLASTEGQARVSVHQGRALWTGVINVLQPSSAALAQYLDSDGSFLWSYQITSGSITSTAQDETGLYLTGSAPLGPISPINNLPSSVPILRKLDSNGIEAWTRIADTSVVSGFAASTTKAGRCTVTGSSRTSRCLVQEYDSSGVLAWSVELGTGTVTSSGSGVAQSNGRLAVVGSVTGQFDGQTSSGGTDAFVALYRTGNNGPSDTTPPVVTIVAPIDGHVTSATSVTVTATVADESATTVTSAPAGVAPGTLPSGGGSVTGAVNLDEGRNQIRVSATDAADNPSATSIDVYRDTAPPVVTISPAEGTIVSTPDLNLAIDVTDQTVTSVELGGNQVGTALVAGGGVYGTSSIQLTPAIQLQEGLNTLVVAATDAAGNRTTVNRSVILDSTAPVVTITTPTDGARYNASSPSLIPLAATVDDATPTVVTGALAGSLGAGGGTLTGTFTLQEGINTIVVTATNPGLNLSATDTVRVTLDTIRPTVAITTPEANACVRGSIELHATATDELPGTVATVQYFVDGVVLPDADLYLIDTTLLADGPHVLRVDATDASGNLETKSITVQVDNTAPSLAITDPIDRAWVGGTIGFSASASDSGTGLVAVSMRVAGGAPTTDGSREYATPVASDFLQSMVDTALASGGRDGDIEFEVTARDCAGNTTKVAVTVRVDNTAPDRVITSPAAGSEVRCVLEVRATVTDPNLARVQFVIDGVAGPVMTTPPFVVSYDTRNRLDGELQIQLIATDLANNVSTSTITVTVDNLEVDIKPTTIQLTSKGGDKSVTVKVEGQSALLMTAVDVRDILLCVPGGSPVPASEIHSPRHGWRCSCECDPSHRGHRKGHEHGRHGEESEVKVKFDRQLLIGALRGAGITDSKVDMTLKVIQSGQTFVIGADSVKVESCR